MNWGDVFSLRSDHDASLQVTGVNLPTPSFQTSKATSDKRYAAGMSLVEPAAHRSDALLVCHEPRPVTNYSPLKIVRRSYRRFAGEFPLVRGYGRRTVG